MFNKSTLTTLFILALSISAFSQSGFSDSLDVQLAEKPDSLQQKILMPLFLQYSNRNYERAHIVGNKALLTLKRLGNADELADFLLRLGQTEYTYGNHDRALQLYIESADLYKKINLPAKEASVYNEIAVLHRKNKNLKKSKEYITAAFDLYKHSYDTNGMATTLCNLGITHEIEEKPETALNYYREALRLHKLIKCELCISYSLDYMAGIFKILHQFDSALYYEGQSLGLRKKLDSKYTIAQSLMTLGEIYLEHGKYAEAIAYFSETAALCRQIQFKDYERTAYEYLAQCHEKIGKFKDAYNYHVKFARLDDSLFNETRSRQINEFQIRYETEKKENEIKSLLQEKRIKNLTISEQSLQITNTNYLLVTVIVSAIMILIAGFVLYKQQRLKARVAHEGAAKEREETDRLRIAKDIHDELGSGLSKIHFLSQDILNQNSGTEHRKNVSSVMEISGNLIQNMRDLVWELNNENSTLDNLIAQIREYSADYLEDLPLKVVANYPDLIPEVQLRKMVYRNIFMVVKEALHNIVKHSNAAHVYLAIAVPEDHLNISIEDDGDGFKGKAKLQGNGLLNMESRIQSIGGTLILSSPKRGVCVSLRIRLSQITKL
jgi:signal transduction histidine kinase